MLEGLTAKAKLLEISRNFVTFRRAAARGTWTSVSRDLSYRLENAHPRATLRCSPSFRLGNNRTAGRAVPVPKRLSALSSRKIPPGQTARLKSAAHGGLRDPAPPSVKRRRPAGQAW